MARYTRSMLDEAIARAEASVRVTLGSREYVKAEMTTMRHEPGGAHVCVWVGDTSDGTMHSECREFVIDDEGFLVPAR